MYLDTSSIVKRYVAERGSPHTDRIYERAETGKHTIVMSLWNVGEVFGVLDTYHSRRLMDDDTFLQSPRHFLAESQKMIRLGNMESFRLRPKS